MTTGFCRTCSSVSVYITVFEAVIPASKGISMGDKEGKKKVKIRSARNSKQTTTEMITLKMS